MAKTALEARATKEAAVDEIRTKLGESEAAVLTEYRGLSVTALAELRAALRPSETEYKVFKNTLARRAVEEVGATDLVQFLEGPTAIAFVKGDIAAAAKAMKEFAKSNDAFVLKGGILGDKAVTPKEIEALADLPSREVLLSQIAGLFEAPLSQMASLLEGSARNVLYAVNALIEKREQSGEATESE
ncbi:MAG: 50S ribosomal protein L10 [Acidimicrobiia bacterium]